MAVPLVDYASSSDSEPESVLQGTKRKRSPTQATPKAKQRVPLPPLPSHFHDLYASSVRVSTQDDPELHQGRQRQVPHVQGNWPSHVYIEWFAPSAELKILTEVFNDAAAQVGPSVHVHSSLKSDLGVPQPLHISLSTPLTLQTATRHDFADQLKERLRALRLRPFKVSLGDVIWAANSTLDRFFLAVRAEKPEGDELNRLLKACNEVAEEAKQPVLYSAEAGSDASQHFHFSIGWTLQQPAVLDPKLSLIAPAVASVAGERRREKMQKIKVSVEAVKVKIGNEQISLPLSDANDSDNITPMLR